MTITIPFPLIVLLYIGAACLWGWAGLFFLTLGIVLALVVGLPLLALLLRALK